ncbi:hypothetical protein QBC44DRAFT_29477 [Cladorrhinum sp. PSN332]|nr:hypothetical protein QBC44DRAFT_29477 [Cladorrhinum sp. PSN332]
MGGTFWRHEAREMEADSLNQPPGTPLEHEGQTAVKAGTSWGWTLEVLSIVGSVGWMTGVVAILGTMRDRPLSDWTFFLSLPATLAIFATAAKLTAAIAVSACISQYKWIHFKKAPRRLVDLDLFDSASRGPLGSLILLCRRPKGLASIGALVTILALALDVFVQQVIKLDEEDVFKTGDGRAKLGMVHTWNGTSKLPGAIVNTVASAFAAAVDESDVPMQGAIYRGVFKLQNPPVFQCNATARCIWDDPVVTLGFKSTCADVSEETFRSANSSLFGSLSGKGQNLTTPGGILLPAVYSPTSFQTVVSIGAKSLLSSTVVDPALTMVNPDIARIAVFKTAANDTNFQIFLNTSRVFECHLGLVAYRFANISASDAADLTILKSETIPLQPGVATGARPGIYNGVEFRQEGLPPLKASLADMRAVTVLLTSARFSGSIFRGFSGFDAPAGMGDALRTDWAVPQIFENMAKSMTDQLRSNYSVVAEGVSVDKAVFVHVHWEWLILPLIVELVSIAFVVAVLVKSRKAKDVQLWKSSAVAILTHALSFQEGSAAVGTLGANVQSVTELETMSNRVKVKLG